MVLDCDLKFPASGECEKTESFESLPSAPEEKDYLGSVHVIEQSSFVTTLNSLKTYECYLKFGFDMLTSVGKTVILAFCIEEEADVNMNGI